MRAAKRSGWGFVVADGQTPMWGKFGCLAEHYPSVVKWNYVRYFRSCAIPQADSLCMSTIRK